jgi:hypothetical protein
LATQAAQDHLKGILAKSANEHYKPWRNTYAPKNPHSPFGDFPTEYLPKSKLESKKVEPNYEISQSGLSLSTEHLNPDKYERQRGNGGMTSSTLPKKLQHEPPVPKCGAFMKRDIQPSDFRRYYDRGDMPIRVDHQSTVPKLIWKLSPETLDYHHYLPIFFDGLRERVDPYRTFAIMGTYDLLEKGGTKILPVIPQLIIPIKSTTISNSAALNTRDPEVISIMLKVLQKLVLSG